jgi:2,3-dihydroxybenzoate---[aryl-carrier protein] ligase
MGNRVRCTWIFAGLARRKEMDGFIPWPAEFPQKYRDAGYWLDKTISEAMDESFARFESQTALILDDGRRFTYAELRKLSTRLALHLNALGLELYDRLVLQMPNMAELVITYLAALKAGVIPIMALAPHREAEIGYFAKLSEARALAVAASFRGFDYQEMASEVWAKNSTLEHVLVAGGEPRRTFHSINAFLKDPIEDRVTTTNLPRPDPDLPAVIILSGGTTGVPKLVPHTHNDYVYISRRNAEICEFDQDTVTLIAIPQGHNFALATPGLQAVLFSGGCEVLSSDPSPVAMMNLIQEHRVTHCSAVPTLILGMLDHPKRSNYDISSLKVILTGGAKLNPEIAVRIRPELGCEVQQVLGMAEGFLFWTRLGEPDEINLYTQGRPQSPGDEFKIVDPVTGIEVPEGEMGEVWGRGPHTIRGYYRAPEYNAKAFTPDGFYKTGDLVRLHPSGNIISEGRIKDCINRGGEKISAEEIENHILAHPQVESCACVAMPDPMLGERTCAYVIPSPGSELTLEGLNEFLLNERKIAKFKLPERLELVDAFPVTPVGKLSKKTLREMIAARVEAERAAVPTREAQ